MISHACTLSSLFLNLNFQAQIELRTPCNGQLGIYSDKGVVSKPIPMATVQRQTYVEAVQAQVQVLMSAMAEIIFIACQVR